jgi:deoxyribodipyrimidine photo-lyase
MYSIFIFRRDLRLFDNTTLIRADQESKKDETKIIPIFIFDQHQIEDKNKSDNCVQFLVESLSDLKLQLKEYGSTLYTFYGKPWNVVEDLINKYDIKNVYVNQDYTVYSKERDNKIMQKCQKYSVNFISQEDCMLNNIDTIKTTTNKFYEKFTPYYNSAKKNKIREPNKHKYKNLIKKNQITIKTYDKTDKLFKHNPDLYIHGGRNNGLKILKNIKKFKDYNEIRNFPEYDTTLLSPHNKFGTVSIREVYYHIKNNLRKSTLLQQLYWRDFYYNQMYFNEEYFYLNYGKYSNLKWNNNMINFKKWKNGETGIPIVDAGMKQLNKTGWIHNRIRMLVATALTKILLIDWRLGENYFKKKLLDYDISQNIMNWYWISGEAPFANPYFRVLNPDLQTKKNDKDCNYTKKWIEIEDNCLSQNPIVDIPVMIQKSIQKYKKK